MTTRNEENSLDTAGRIRRNPKPALGILLLMCLGVSGCGRAGGEHGAHGMFGMQHLAHPLMKGAMHLGMRSMRTHGGGIRRACAEDMERFCPKTASRREQRECLEGKRASLREECRTALDARHKGGEQIQH